MGFVPRSPYVWMGLSGATRWPLMLVKFNEYAWEMTPSLYLQDAGKPHKRAVPLYWGDNPVRP